MIFFGSFLLWTRGRARSLPTAGGSSILKNENVIYLAHHILLVAVIRSHEEEFDAMRSDTDIIFDYFRSFDVVLLLNMLSAYLLFLV